MAATDQAYRRQKTLDVVFGASCVLMLLSIIWMFAQDYFREYKVEIRDFRDVEEAMAERDLLRLVPTGEKLKAVEAAEADLAEAQKALADKHKQVENDINQLLPKKAKDEAAAQATKADYDSLVSIYNIEVDKRNQVDPGSSAYQTLESRANRLDAEVRALEKKLADQQLAVEQDNQRMDEFKKKSKPEEERVEKAAKRLKDLTDEFDRFAKLAVQKRWRKGDRFRTLPVFDAFASPTRIDQITLADLPIDYNFKYVTRYDRCMTCHQGIDRPTYTREALRNLTQEVSADDQKKLETAITLLNNRRNTLGQKAVEFDIDDLRLRPLTDKELSRSRINEYCAHPHLDLFVDGASPHPAQAFGCTICHSGQGSATDFNLASHTPNNTFEKERWQTALDWESNHFWDFPMMPRRFVESSCLKCHYQVTDLLPTGVALENRAGKQVESPGAKVVRGYNLVRENGCFGCHEISGIKGNRSVGPDLRLELSPPLEELSPADQAKVLADPLNPPGTMRKVGPSLRRLSEKTNQKWIRQWVQDPRGFRPDTRMPHFYNQSNNNPDVLPEDQKGFPAAEIHGIAYYLFHESANYVQGKNAPKDKPPVTPIEKKLIAGDGTAVKLPDWAKGDLQAGWAKDDPARKHVENGQRWFTEKGCLACHSHPATTQILKENVAPNAFPEANFGPNLGRIAAKVAPEGAPEGKWRWLVQWIMNPNIHSPRTRMPITHLNVDQAAEIASWLMSQPATTDDWTADPAEPAESTLKELARIYLEKGLGRTVTKEVLDNQGFSDEQIAEMEKDKDEVRLARSSSEDKTWTDKLKWYVGKKALAAYGCFGCHDIPGFDGAKPIGTPLNDWGKKDPERLAFEDAITFVKKNYHIVPQRDDPRDPAKPGFDWQPKKENGKELPPYEQFFFDALDHHQREGFLHQKLKDPRSYDYDRKRTWDDRLRMPQFRFSRSVPGKNATAEEIALADKAEAEAREAVMTFVLGLVAEPIPLKYVHEPNTEKLAIAKGKQVLDKFNCAGCHQLRSGVYEVQTNGAKRAEFMENLEAAYTNSLPSVKVDSPTPGYNAWYGRLSPHPNRLMVHGLPIKEDEQLQVRLTQALRFVKKPEDIRDPEDSKELKPGTYDIPAASVVPLPAGELVSRQAPEGGVLPEILAPYLVKKKETFLDDATKARAQGLPPPLLREGERVQPSWLFQFLRNPQPIRPLRMEDAQGNKTGVLVLRMPKFNMSDDEAMTLVNYFAAIDRRENPNIQLSSPYLTIPQRDEGFLAARSQEYLTQFDKKQRDDKFAKVEKEVWERIQKDPANEVKDLKSFRAEWDKNLYSDDAYRFLASYKLCLNCHQVGNLPASQPQGPSLNLSADRLRPDWTERWIANPARLLIYKEGLHPMPQSFNREHPDYQELFKGTSYEQARGVRDTIMRLQQVADQPANRYYKPPASTEGAK